jgi:phosphatidylglycerol:prolipoprotein diacylglycerol transferase
VSPILLRFGAGDGEFVLRAYATFYTLAWVLAPLVAVWLAERRGVPRLRALAVYAPALAAGVVGARALDLFVAGRFYADDPSRATALAFQGFSLYGGLAVAAVVAIAIAVALRLPVWRLADSAVPALALGVVLMRTGCFLNGCCYGIRTELPWGVTYPVGSYAWDAQMLSGTGGLLSGFMGRVYPVHPTQLYEMAGVVLCAAVALWLQKRRVAEGAPFLAFAAGFTLVRLGNHFLRARQPVITAPEWFYPLVYAAILLVLGALLTQRMHARQSHDR